MLVAWVTYRWSLSAAPPWGWRTRTCWGWRGSRHPCHPQRPLVEATRTARCRCGSGCPRLMRSASSELPCDVRDALDCVMSSVILACNQNEVNQRVTSWTGLKMEGQSYYQGAVAPSTEIQNRDTLRSRINYGQNITSRVRWWVVGESKQRSRGIRVQDPYRYTSLQLFGSLN